MLSVMTLNLMKEVLINSASLSKFTFQNQLCKNKLE